MNIMSSEATTTQSKSTRSHKYVVHSMSPGPQRASRYPTGITDSQTTQSMYQNNRKLEGKEDKTPTQQLQHVGQRYGSLSSPSPSAQDQEEDSYETQRRISYSKRFDDHTPLRYTGASASSWSHKERTEVGSGQQEIQALQISESNASYDYLSLQRERNLRAKLQLMESQLDKTEQRVRSLRIEAKEREYDVQRLQRDLDQANSIIESHEETIARYADDKRMLEEQNESLREKLQEASSSIQSMQSSMMLNHKEATTTEQTLRNENSALEETIEDLRSKLRRQETLTYSAEMEVKSKAKTIKDYEDQIEKLRKRNHALEETTKYRQIASDIERKYNLERDRNAALKHEMDKAVQDYTRLYQYGENDGSHLARFLENMSSELSQIVYDVEGKMNSLGIPHSINEGSPKKHKRYETTFQLPMMKHLAGPLATVSGAIDSMHPTVNELMRFVNAFVTEKSEKDTLASRLSAAEVELKSARNDIQETKEALRKEKEDHRQTQDELKERQAQVTKLKEKNNHLEDEISELSTYSNETTVTGRMMGQLISDSSKRVLKLQSFLHKTFPAEFSTFGTASHNQSDKDLPKLLAELESDLHTLTAALKRCFGEITSLRKESTYWQSEAAQLKEKLRILDTENSQFTEVVRNSLQTLAK